MKTSRVAIITDTNNCLPPELLKEFGIRVVPLSLTIDGKPYRDQVDITPGQFWQKWGTFKECTTGAPAPGDWVEAFKDAARETDDIVCIMLSKALSATYSSAAVAKNMLKAEYPDLNIELVDSRTAIGALGFIVLEAAKAARAGQSPAEVIKKAGEMVERVKWVVGLLTTQTQKFHRAPDSIFDGLDSQVIPLISMLHATGKVEDGGKAQGKEGCFKRMLEVLGENMDASKPLHAIVHYTTSLEDGQRLLKRVQSKYQPVESYLTPYSPVLGASSGPAIALVFYS